MKICFSCIRITGGLSCLVLWDVGELKKFPVMLLCIKNRNDPKVKRLRFWDYSVWLLPQPWLCMQMFSQEFRLQERLVLLQHWSHPKLHLSVLWKQIISKKSFLIFKPELKEKGLKHLEDVLKALQAKLQYVESFTICSHQTALLGIS
jgi:hypothetical protein